MKSLLLTNDERRNLPWEMQKYSPLYKPNTRNWQVGDYVIHDDDNKRLGMLMVVVGIRKKDGKYITKYAIPLAQPKSWRKRWYNPVFKLHDPALFGIPVP